jgi:hypothetical protein
MQRRQFLTRTGAVAVPALVAGCSGGNQDTDGGAENGGDGSSGSDGQQQATETQTETELDFPSEELSFLVYGASGGGHDAYARFMEP